MKVGIYIPAYNVEKYVEESLKSIMKQTFRDFYVVIVDDYSTDNTKEIVSKVIKDDKRFVLYERNEHSGKIGQVKNEAISHLPDCDYICHVGSDDLIPPSCLEIFVSFMDKHTNIGACCGTFECFNEKDMWILPHVANSGKYDRNTLLQYMCLFPHRFYRKSVVEMVGGYSNELSSAVDYDLALKLDEVTEIYRIQSPITYYYRQHSQQVSTKSRKEQDLNAKKALQNALLRRKMSYEVVNDKPPFKIVPKKESHFIWGKK